MAGAKINTYNGIAYGVLNIEEDTSGPGVTQPDLKIGGVSVVNPVAEAQADSTAVDVAGIVADFNALLAKLRTAGIIAT